MSTNPMPKNVSCFKNLALNILKNSSQEVITKGVEVPELDPCSKCKEKLFFCLEDYVKDLPQCPEYAIEIESIDYIHYFGTSEHSSQDQVQSCKSEDNSKETIQDVIRAYCNFGWNFKKRLKYYKKNHKKQVAQILVNDEVRIQLPKEISDNASRNKTE
ncbi:hypothetical protein F8M41_023114 [Gigaspora margarita]|uniref:Uncharacterized protein n=1 Tax=Gigaspora margarita TaxID=4874 RepID=A0A8H4AE08_GIGMA|nr:hypothetical protein F8M41_023114 [Gigaspora margarita]